MSQPTKAAEERACAPYSRRPARETTSFTLTALLVANPAHSQIGQSEIVGTVTDASRAVLPGVAVTATQVGVGFTRTTVTNSRGRYTFTQLPVGKFEFVFELNGFETSRVGPMELNVGERPTLNVTMQIAGVAETILVEPVTPQIETTRSEISHTVQNIQIQELPVLGRDWLGFAVLAPGIKSDRLLAEGSRDGTICQPTLPASGSAARTRLPRSLSTAPM